MKIESFCWPRWSHMFFGRLYSSRLISLTGLIITFFSRCLSELTRWGYAPERTEVSDLICYIPNNMLLIFAQL